MISGPGTPYATRLPKKKRKIIIIIIIIIIIKSGLLYTGCMAADASKQFLRAMTLANHFLKVLLIHT